MNTVYLYLELKSSQYCFIMFSVPVSHIFWQIYSYIFHTCCLYLFVANLEIQFCILITHSATLLNTLVSFCFRVHEISYFIMSSPNKDSFVSSFPIWMPLFFFSCFVSLAGTRITNPMWNKSSKSIQLRFAPELMVKAFNHLPFSMMLALVLFCFVFEDVLH